MHAHVSITSQTTRNMALKSKSIPLWKVSRWIDMSLVGCSKCLFLTNMPPPGILADIFFKLWVLWQIQWWIAKSKEMFLKNNDSDESLFNTIKEVSIKWHSNSCLYAKKSNDTRNVKVNYFDESPPCIHVHTHIVLILFGFWNSLMIFVLYVRLSLVF